MKVGYSRFWKILPRASRLIFTWAVTADSTALHYDAQKKYKETHPDTKLIFIFPYQNKWLEDRRAQIEKEYDEIIYPELERVPLKFAILKRNEFMVGQADRVICYVQTHYGGAYKTLLYAHKRKKSYVNLYQGDYELY